MDKGTRLVILLVSVPFGLGVLALVGHFAGLPLLVSVRPGFRGMSTLTAFCAVLLAIGLGAASAGKARVGLVSSRGDAGHPDIRP